MNSQERAARRLAINKDETLRVHLNEWESERTRQILITESYRGRCNAAKAELYQLVGFYFVFQGVVFTAVAQANHLSCRTSWCPALLSFLASAATLISVHYKLDYYAEEKFKLIRAQHTSGDIDNKIRLLTANNFSFALLDGINDEMQERTQLKEAQSRRWFWWVVMSFLFFFSIIVLAICIVVLCWT